jgi:hypothetical protein
MLTTFHLRKIILMPPFPNAPFACWKKGRAIREMVRIVKPGGYVGLHDVCWKDNTPERFKQRLVEFEGERPETIEGWKELFAKAGLDDVRTVDKSHMMSAWTKSLKKKLGVIAWVRAFFSIIHLWGIRSVGRILQSEKIFASECMGYGLVVRRKPAASRHQ